MGWLIGAKGRLRPRKRSSTSTSATPPVQAGPPARSIPPRSFSTAARSPRQSSTRSRPRRSVALPDRAEQLWPRRQSVGGADQSGVGRTAAEMALFLGEHDLALGPVARQPPEEVDRRGEIECPADKDPLDASQACSIARKGSVVHEVA